MWRFNQTYNSVITENSDYVTRFLTESRLLFLLIFFFNIDDSEGPLATTNKQLC